MKYYVLLKFGKLLALYINNRHYDFAPIIGSKIYNLHSVYFEKSRQINQKAF